MTYERVPYFKVFNCDKFKISALLHYRIWIAFLCHRVHQLLTL